MLTHNILDSAYKTVKMSLYKIKEEFQKVNNKIIPFLKR